MNMNQEHIKQIVKERNIKFLLHFTSVRNLSSILRNGLLSRIQLISKKIEYQFNDQKRYDGCLDSVCCSVSFPNSILFSVFRSVYFNRCWVVLALDPSILWEKTCYFCASNAAKKEMSYLIRYRTSSSDFEKMFAKVVEGHHRNDIYKIDDSYPTNPKAEVVIPNGIETKYIKHIFTNSNRIVELYAEQFNQFDFQCEPAYFQDRKDYRLWCHRY